MPSLITIIPVPPTPALDVICLRADALGAHVIRGGDGATIEAARGRIVARPAGAGLEVALSAEGEADLQALRAALDGFASGSGLAALDWRAGSAGTGKGNLIEARILGNSRISPSYRRIRLEGDFSAFAKGGLHFRLALGPEGAEGPVPDPGGGIDWPGGIDVWHRPPYTVRALGPANEWMDFDIFLHEGGRVTEWCHEATPGSHVLLTGPGGRGVKQARWMGMIGDETALPVILRALEAAAPDTRGMAMILIPDVADIQPVTAPLGLALRWILRREGRTLRDLLAELDPPEADRFIFFAGERAEAAAAREDAKARGLGAGEFHAAAYWTRGWIPPLGQRRAKGLRFSPADGG